LTRGKKNVLGEVSLVFIGYNLSRFMQITEGVNALKELIKSLSRAYQELYRSAYTKTVFFKADISLQ